MTERNDLLGKAAQLMARSADESRREPSREVRTRAVAAMEEALRARAAKKRRSALFTRVAVAAGVVLGVLGGARLYASREKHAQPVAPEIAATARGLDGRTTAFRDGREVPFQGKLASGDRVATAEGAHAEIALSTGTSVVLSQSSEVTLTTIDRVQAFGLGAGTINARVAKLHEGERFLVRTADAEVEVRGTVFAVSVVKPDLACGNGTPTRVHVSEGVVVVRKDGVESRVAAGEEWPSGCAVTPPAPAASAAPSAVASAVPSAIPSVVPVVHAPSPVVSASASIAPPSDVLATKNDLFASALSAKNHGQLHTALAGFDAYLSKYPDGELVESASAQRMGILAKIDPPRGVAAAKQYLARWPNGFAHEEAEAIATAAP